MTGRALQGVALAGVPAVAMTYLAEEIGAAGLGTAMGVYISDTTLGGLAGRLIPSFTLEAESWRWAAVGVAATLCAIWFARPWSRPYAGQQCEVPAQNRVGTFGDVIRTSPGLRPSRLRGPGSARAAPRNG